ncbi:MAG: hypothetical protein ACLFNN_03470 [Candidatus Paceibacterota bacterium]
MDEKNKKIEMDYIRSQREKGVNDEAIKKALREAGWSEEDISIGFSELDGQQDVPQKQTEEKSKEEPKKAEEDNSFGSSLNDVPEEGEQQAEKQKSEEGAPETSPEEKPSDNNAMPSGFTKSETSGSTEGGVKSEDVAGAKEATESNTPAEEGGAAESEAEQAKPSATPASETPSVGVSDNVAAAKTGQEEEVKEDPMADLPEQGSENMLKITLLVIVTLLILGGAGVAAYFIVQGMGGNMDDMSKEEIINESVLSYVKADSFSNVTEVGLSLDEFAEAELLVDGSYKKAESLEDHLMDLKFDGSFVFREGGMTMNLGAKGELRVVDGESYVYLEEAPAIPFAGDLSPLEGQWLSMGVEEGLDESGVSFEGGITQIEEDAIKAIEEFGVRFLELGQEKKALTISELDDKDGVKIYSIDIDMENMPGLMRALPEEFPPLAPHKQDILEGADEVEEDLKDMKEEHPDFDLVFPLEVRVDKKDLHLRQVSLELSREIPAEDLSSMIDKEELSLDLSIVSSFSDIGKGFDVEKPDAEKSLEEAADELLGQTFDEASGDEELERSDVLQTSEEDTVKVSLEDVQSASRSYEESYGGICEKEDMKEAIEEAVDLAGADGEVSDYCNDGEEYWVVAVPEKDESVSCTDSQGVIIEVDQNFERPLSSDVESCSDPFSLDDEEQQLEISSGLSDLLRAGAGWVWK